MQSATTGTADGSCKCSRRSSRTGAAVEVPTTRTRGDYVNVRPPVVSRRRGRVCSVHVHSGRVEFQEGSWDRLTSRDGFHRLEAGNKAARSPNSDADLDAIIAAFRHEVAEIA